MGRRPPRARMQDINVAFVSTPLVPPCKCWATEWLSAESRANRICNKQTSTFDAKNWLTQNVST